MNHSPPWNPYDDWTDARITWNKVAISKEDLQRFCKRSNLKGLAQSLGFLLLVALTGSLAYLAFSQGRWILMTVALLVHGTVFSFFGPALHELTHNTVFATPALNTGVTWLFGWLFWPHNPFFYRLSHQGYHHRYTLYQGSDGEDVPNYLQYNGPFFYEMFLHVLKLRELVHNVARLATGLPTAKGWRGRAYRLDNWERFILERASEKRRREILAFGWFCLVTHALFIAVCVATGNWFVPLLVTFAPFYDISFFIFATVIPQHAGMDANDPDFRHSCATVKLNPLSSFLYWHMEYHTEHHMFAAIPCYNLRRFRAFIEDQMPPRERGIVRLIKLHRLCKEKYGSWQNWRDTYGRFKGF